MTTSAIIGTVKIAAGTKLRIECENPAWFTDIEAPEQVVPVTAHFDDRGDINCWPGAHYGVRGKVVASNYSSYYCGNLLREKVNEETGERVKPIGIYGYVLAAAVGERGGVINDNCGTFTLDPAYVAEVSKEYEADRWDPVAGVEVTETRRLWTIRRRVPAQEVAS